MGTKIHNCNGPTYPYIRPPHHPQSSPTSSCSQINPAVLSLLSCFSKTSIETSQTPLMAPRAISSREYAIPPPLPHPCNPQRRLKDRRPNIPHNWLYRQDINTTDFACVSPHQIAPCVSILCPTKESSDRWDTLRIQLPLSIPLSPSLGERPT